MMKAKWWIAGLTIALFLAIISPLASTFPDGLEKVSEDLGFIDRASEAAYGLMPDYAFPGVENKAVATVLAGILGTLVMLGLGFGVAYVLKKKNEA